MSRRKDIILRKERFIIPYEEEVNINKPIIEKKKHNIFSEKWYKNWKIERKRVVNYLPFTRS